MKNCSWLPIGSVVILKGAKAPCMIVSRLAKEAERDRVWDYIACPYPFGVEQTSGFAGFYAESIEKILHIGYLSDMESELARRLTEAKQQGLD